MAMIALRQLLDHAADYGANPAVYQRSIRSGFTSVMMDCSLAEDTVWARQRGRQDNGTDRSPVSSSRLSLFDALR